ncbi:MAG: ornithine cyclodeaminase family protein [Halanaeroarchaeum sp.]
MIRFLPSDDVQSVLSLAAVLEVVADAFASQKAGTVERPERPHFPVGRGLDETDPDEPMGTGLVMPAYVHGDPYFATKLVSVHDRNPERGLPTINAQVVLADAATGVPVAFLDGTYITAARTSAIGGLSARALTDGAIDVGVVGAGTQARWQVRAIDAATEVRAIRFFDLDGDALGEAVDELDAELTAPVSAADSAADTVADVDVVVTATTSPEPVFPGDALAPGTVVVAIGAYTPEMQEVGPDTFERAARVFADVPAAVAQIGDVRGAGVGEDDLVPFADLLDGSVGRDPEDVVIVESVGSAVMDAATARYVYEAAADGDVGTTLEF